MSTQRIDFLTSALFTPTPKTWCLRGDPFLWRELSELFSALTLADFAKNPRLHFGKAFQRLTGQDIAQDTDIFVERYSRGGISSGLIRPSYWRDSMYDLLCQRLALWNEASPGEEPPIFRVATWNCRDKPYKAYEHFRAELKADILVVQESKQPPAIVEGCTWSGTKHGSKGVAVFAGQGIDLFPIQVELPANFQVMHSTYPTPFRVCAVWAKSEQRHIQGVHKAIDYLEERGVIGPGAGDVLALGDFNSNVIWDHQ